MALEILNGDCVFFINHEWNATTSLPPTHNIDPQHWGALLVLNTQLWWLTWDFPAMFSHVFQSVHVQLASTDINLHYVFISLCFQAYQWGIGLLNGPVCDQTSKCSLFLLLIWCRSEPSITEDCDEDCRTQHHLHRQLWPDSSALCVSSLRLCVQREGRPFSCSRAGIRAKLQSTVNIFLIVFINNSGGQFYVSVLLLAAVKATLEEGIATTSSLSFFQQTLFPAFICFSLSFLVSSSIRLHFCKSFFSWVCPLLSLVPQWHRSSVSYDALRMVQLLCHTMRVRWLKFLHTFSSAHSHKATEINGKTTLLKNPQPGLGLVLFGRKAWNTDSMGRIANTSLRML